MEGIGFCLDRPAAGVRELESSRCSRIPGSRKVLPRGTPDEDPETARSAGRASIAAAAIRAKGTFPHRITTRLPFPHQCHPVGILAAHRSPMPSPCRRGGLPSPRSSRGERQEVVPLPVDRQVGRIPSGPVGVDGKERERIVYRDLPGTPPRQVDQVGPGIHLQRRPRRFPRRPCARWKGSSGRTR